MIIITQEKNILNSQHIMYFEVIENPPTMFSRLVAKFPNNNIEVLVGMPDEIKNARNSLIEAFSTGASCIDFSITEKDIQIAKQKRLVNKMDEFYNDLYEEQREQM